MRGCQARCPRSDFSPQLEERADRIAHTNEGELSGKANYSVEAVLVGEKVAVVRHRQRCAWGGLGRADRCPRGRLEIVLALHLIMAAREGAEDEAEHFL